MATAANDIVFLHEAAGRDHLPLPAIEQFTSEDGRLRDFLADTTLASLMSGMINEYAELHWLAASVPRIGTYYKREGGKENGTPKLGGVRITRGLLRDTTGFTVVLWIAWDHAQSYDMTTDLARKVLYHNLMHLSLNDKSKFVMRPHDFEGFTMEVERFGPWHGDLSRAKVSFDQAALPFGEPAGIVP